MRNAAAGRDWSEAIPLLGGGGGSDSAFAAWRSSESIAAGEGAVADGPNATAFGFNAVAAGPGSMTAIGTDTKASCNFSTAVGNYCTEAAGAYAAAFGSWAKALADGCVQLGTGQNEHANTLQFRDYQLLDADGKIPAERLTGYPAIAGLDPDALADADHTSFAQVCAAVSAIVKALKNQ